MLVGALGVTDLTGYSCTRLYVEMNNADDFMSSVSGDAINPTYINTTTSTSTMPPWVPARRTASTACSSRSIPISPTTAG